MVGPCCQFWSGLAERIMASTSEGGSLTMPAISATLRYSPSCATILALSLA